MHNLPKSVGYLSEKSAKNEPSIKMWAIANL